MIKGKNWLLIIYYMHIHILFVCHLLFKLIKLFLCVAPTENEPNQKYDNKRITHISLLCGRHSPWLRSRRRKKTTRAIVAQVFSLRGGRCFIWFEIARRISQLHTFNNSVASNNNGQKFQYLLGRVMACIRMTTWDQRNTTITNAYGCFCYFLIAHSFDYALCFASQSFFPDRHKKNEF